MYYNLSMDIEIVIAKDGSLSYTVRGVKGSSCKDLTKAIDALGAVTETKTTGEYMQIDNPARLQTKG